MDTQCHDANLVEVDTVLEHYVDYIAKFGNSCHGLDGRSRQFEAFRYRWMHCNARVRRQKFPI